MSISRETVEKIAYLARIAIRDEDVAKYASDMSQVFELGEQLNQVDTTDIAPLAHPLKGIRAKLRCDEITEHCDGSLQTLTQFVEADLYLVPKVIEE